ncbi:hypothetical protein P7C70_g8487, partial [Phenoliferia sp. Uapishka_3]
MEYHPLKARPPEGHTGAADDEEADINLPTPLPPFNHQSQSSRSYWVGVVLFAVAMLSVGTAFGWTLRSGTAWGVDGTRTVVEEAVVVGSEAALKSDQRGYVALLFSGTARSFSDNFESVVINLIAGCPYTVHLFFHTYSNDNRWPDDAVDPDFANYRSVNATLDYFRGYTNLDGEEVLFKNAVKGNVLEELKADQLPHLYPEFNTTFERFNDPVFNVPVVAYYYMWRSGEQAEELRQAYMNSTGIDYKWAFRMRHDATYFTNWWDKAFDISIYNSTLDGEVPPDVASNWGESPTRLHDMLYRPSLSPTNYLYVPQGWSWGGLNDQFAAMSSSVAFSYFTRILHINDMIAEGFKIHAETSILWVAKHYGYNGDSWNGGICYDVVRAVPTGELRKGPPAIACSYKRSGVEACSVECPKYHAKNDLRATQFIGDVDDGSDHFPTLQEYLDRKNAEGLGNVDLEVGTSSFYYYHLARQKDKLRCTQSSWTPDQRSNFGDVEFPFVLKSEEVEVAVRNAYWLAQESDADIDKAFEDMAALGLKVVRTWAFNDVTAVQNYGAYYTFWSGTTQTFNSGPNGAKPASQLS